jgi:hypothetical protein
VAAGVLALAVVSGCSGSTGGPQPPSSSTATSPASGTASASASPSSTPVGSISDVKGRAHDAGTVVSSTTIDGVHVLVLDRWTVVGMSDAQLAAKGAPISPHTSRRFYDQNSHKTYKIPVDPSAVFVDNSCAKATSTAAPGSTGPAGKTPAHSMVSTPESLADFLAKNQKNDVVLLTYNSTGWLVRLDTDPVC